jgi:ribonuclease III
MEALAGRLGWQVSDAEWLTRSLAHRSWGAETPGGDSNERLEFLGDAVLGLVVADYLFRTYPTLPEGELTKVRASVVNSATLADVAASLDVGDALLLGKGEGRSGGREKPSILADAMEALIGAVYLDQGWEAASDLVMRLLGDLIEQAAVGPGGRDYKTRLQEVCARRFDELPCYRVTDKGPDHAKSFDASVRIGGQVWGTGQGRSKKQAEQAAARMAWTAVMAAEPAEPAEAAEPAESPTPAERAGPAGLVTPDAASAPAAGRA